MLPFVEVLDVGCNVEIDPKTAKNKKAFKSIILHRTHSLANREMETTIKKGCKN